MYEEENGFSCVLSDTACTLLGKTVHITIGSSTEGKKTLTVFTDEKWCSFLGKITNPGNNLPPSTVEIIQRIVRPIVANEEVCEISDGRLYISKHLAAFIGLSTESTADLSVDENGIILIMFGSGATNHLADR